MEGGIARLPRSNGNGNGGFFFFFFFFFFFVVFLPNLPLGLE
jgi:hypothetical protein